MRNEAMMRRDGGGPRVFITGNSQSGKSSITKTLVNYSVKLGWTPMLVDLDVTQNSISAPGCLSASLVESMISGSTDNLTFKTITYFHGACAPGNFIITPDLFDTQINELAKACDAKTDHDLKQFKIQNQLL